MYMYQDGEENPIISDFRRNSSTMECQLLPDAIKPNTDPSGSDFYFFVLKKDAESQLYGTFFGQDDPLNVES